MEFNFLSDVDDGQLDKKYHVGIFVILGLSVLFIFPTFFFSLIKGIFLNTDIELLSYIAYFIGYSAYVAILFYLIGKDSVIKILKGFNKNNIITAFIFSVILFIATIATTNFVELIFGSVESNANQDSLDQSMLNYPIIVSIFSVIFAPIVEELVFRYTIFKSINKYNRILAFAVSILSFAGIHFVSSLSVLMTDLANSEVTKEIAYTNFYNDLKTLPIYIVAAFILTLSYDLNKNIATNIMIHSFYNISQVVIILLLMKYMDKIEQVTSSISIFINYFFR